MLSIQKLEHVQILFIFLKKLVLVLFFSLAMSRIIHIALLKQVTSRGTETIFLSGAHVFYIMLCPLLFGFLPIVSWSLYCLAFDLRILITWEIYLKVDICSIFIIIF